MIFRHLLNMRSHPTWVRGLKPAQYAAGIYVVLSHPTWVRGLKHSRQQGFQTIFCRTLRGCVD